MGAEHACMLLTVSARLTWPCLSLPFLVAAGAEGVGPVRNNVSDNTQSTTRRASRLLDAEQDPKQQLQVGTCMTLGTQPPGAVHLLLTPWVPHSSYDPGKGGWSYVCNPPTSCLHEYPSYQLQGPRAPTSQQPAALQRQSQVSTHSRGLPPFSAH
jgi:hypothetical protein